LLTSISHDQSPFVASESATRQLVRIGQFAFIPTGILTTLLGPMLPILIARWALSDAQAGNLFLVQFLASLVAVQLSGVLLARAGFRTPFLLGLLLMAAGVGALYEGSAWLGLVSVALYGLGVGFIIPTDNLLIAEVGAGSRTRALSLLNFYWGMGAVLCALLVAWTYAHKLLPFFLRATALSLALLALAARSLPFPGAIESRDPSLTWRQIWQRRSAWLFAAVFFLYPGAETAVGGWIGSYVTRMGLKPAIGPLMPAFFWSALALGRVVGSRVLHLWPEQRILRIGFALGSGGIALLLWSSSLAEVIASAALTGLSFSTLYPITVARLSRQFGVEARTIGSVMFSLASLGPALLPWTVGLISNAAGNLRAGLVVPLAATVILLGIHLTDW
jgi:MFS transporter, FHS family, glucose/mannose:H+ symporter